MRVGGRTGFVGVLTQIRGVTVMIDRVKVLDLFAATNVPRDDVRRMNRIDGPRLKPGIVRRIIPGTNGMREPLRLQDTLNRRDARRVNVQVFKLTLNGARTNQSIARRRCRRRFERFPNGHNGLHNGLGYFSRRSERHTGTISKVGPGILLIDGPPFAKPTRAMVQIATDVATRFPS